MSYLEIYGCNHCPVAIWCGTMIASNRLCNSYQQPKLDKEITLSTIIIKS